MGNWDGALGVRDGLLAETLGLAMARRAADVLSRHRAVLHGADRLTGSGGPGSDGPAGAGGKPGPEAARFAAEDAVFSAVLDAANECLGRFDGRPAADRWCDALLHVLRLAEVGPSR